MNSHFDEIKNRKKFKKLCAAVQKKKKENKKSKSLYNEKNMMR